MTSCVGLFPVSSSAVFTHVSMHHPIHIRHVPPPDAAVIIHLIAISDTISSACLFPTAFLRKHQQRLRFGLHQWLPHREWSGGQREPALLCWISPHCEGIVCWLVDQGNGGGQMCWKELQLAGRATWHLPPALIMKLTSSQNPWLSKAVWPGLLCRIQWHHFNQ